MTAELPAVDGLALYVHLPWCVAKCPYCDFNSHPIPKQLTPGAGNLIAGTSLETDYGAALRADLAAELAHQPRQRRIHSVFFGGGTPSLFGPRTFGALLEQIGAALTSDCEITLEANPGTQEYADFEGYRAVGINRLSFGAQSFDAGQLERLGRIHSPAEILRAFDKARRAGFERINLDLMYALPEQSAAAALNDLAQALALGPEHLSWYQLTLEPKTEFGARPPPLPDESTIAAIEEQGYQHLAAAGFERYEVSAYAQPGEVSRHNLSYWSFGDYLGIGAGAHGKYRSGERTLRRRKASQPRLYLRNSAAADEEAVAPALLPGEFAMNALRLKAGVDASRYTATTGRSTTELEATWAALTEQGLMHADRFAATEPGYRFLNDLVSRFYDAATG
ncbi:MAG: radical SAM family heme chaperone HemW [Pseudomonadota bacterium]